MTKNKFKRSLAIVLLALSANITSPGQRARPIIDERNVRAELNFLSSDAMQGRGSGTIFERIAAEYIGSQFMQFGIEPAGENGADGKPTYVQTVTNTRNSFVEPPTLRFADVNLEHGKEMLVVRTNSDSVSGSLQKLSPNDKPSSNAAVLLKLPEGYAGNPTQAMQAMVSSGASLVLIEETPQTRAAWSSMTARRLGYTSNTIPPKASAMIVLSKESAARVSALPDGSRIQLSGKLAAPELRQTWNAMGKITGSRASSGVILLSSHLDHLGVREGEAGADKIFNGADDDASGSVAVIELARTLAREKRPVRTVYFVCFGSEESGGAGANYFVNNMPFAKDNFIANLEFEMIGRPDAKVKPEELWLTGYERSNLGPELVKHGAKLVQDPHPTENFFQRSDNYTLARQGIIAHTVSSFGLHTDYHRPSDEAKTIDFVHMTRSIESMVRSIEWLINTNFTPSWVEGKKP
jgi:aminopeptidase YwaD